MHALHSDTPPEVEAIVLERLRALGPAGRLRLMLDLNDTVEKLALAGIRQRHGDIGERELRMRLFSLRLDRETMVRAFGWDPEIEGY